jgi:hypothetical protein
VARHRNEQHRVGSDIADRAFRWNRVRSPKPLPSKRGGTDPSDHEPSNTMRWGIVSYPVVP